MSVVGNYAKAGQYSPQPTTGQKVIADPLLNIPEPTIPGACTYNNKTFSLGETLPANSVYCGKTVFNSSITFAPGFHYFKGAQVTTGTDVAIAGDNVMLYFDDTSTRDSTAQAPSL